MIARAIDPMPPLVKRHRGHHGHAVPPDCDPMQQGGDMPVIADVVSRSRKHRHRGVHERPEGLRGRVRHLDPHHLDLGVQIGRTPECRAHHESSVRGCSGQREPAWPGLDGREGVARMIPRRSEPIGRQPGERKGCPMRNHQPDIAMEEGMRKVFSRQGRGEVAGVACGRTAVQPWGGPREQPRVINQRKIEPADPFRADGSERPRRGSLRVLIRKLPPHDESLL